MFYDLVFNPNITEASCVHFDAGRYWTRSNFHGSEQNFGQISLLDTYVESFISPTPFVNSIFLMFL